MVPALRRITAMDVIVAASLCLATQVEIWAPHAMIGTGSVDGSRPVLAATASLGTLALALRRVTPLAATVLVFGAWGVQGVWTTPTQGLTGLIALTLAAYSAAMHSPPIRSTLGAAVAVAAISALATDIADWAFSFGFVAAAWAIGLAMGRRRSQIRVLARRAVALEHERDEAVSRERARIARELHDIVSHRVMTTVIQAQAAQAQISDRDAVQRALAAIDEGGRAALGELRALLGLLRSEETVDERNPQPTLEDLPRLASEARQAGVPVEVRTEGEPRPLPQGVSLAAYRIIQEALTNVLKHGGSAPTAVVLGYEEDRIRLSVADSGPGPAGGNASTGNGLVGMSERVSVYGGSLTTSARKNGGFVVEASIPTEASL